VITIEKRNSDLLIAARFNMETSILEYSTDQKSGYTAHAALRAPS
jgi:hypothetical protein